MAGFPCPYCAHELSTEAQDDSPSLERCPSCAASLQIAYRYRIVSNRGTISGGLLYEAVDDIFGEKVAVLFAPDVDDRAAVERFIEGNRLFAEFGGGRGLVKLREVGSIHDRRPHVVTDWIAGGTLEQIVRKHGTLDHATMIELVSDLLIGLGKAHRTIPRVVHGHIHPGKIGFLDKDRAVLFGFEWAQQVYEPESHLADTFIAAPVQSQSASRASDLQQLGVAIFYAATGQWIADLPLEQQRGRVQAQLTGPLPVAVDRMLAAGDSGYRSAVDALLDFEHLLEGTSTWKPRPRPQEDGFASDLVATSWAGPSPTARLKAPGEGGHEFAEPIEPPRDDYDDDEHDDEDEAPTDLGDALEDIFESELRPPVPSTPPSLPSAARVNRRTLHAAKARAEAQAAQEPKPATKPGKVIAVMIGSMFAFGMCVSAIVDDESTPTPPPPQLQGIERIPTPVPVPEIPEYVEPMPLEAGFVDVHHHTGTIVGPVDISGFDVGERCDVWISPNPSGLNCRWFIDCGEPRRRIYGGGDVGYSTCTVEQGHPTSAQDDAQDAPDGSFVAMLAGSDPMVLVEDRWLLPPTRVMISIDAGGGPTTEFIPDVPLAGRRDRAYIEDAIARNLLPEFEDAAEPLPDQLSADQIREILDSRKDALRECPFESDQPLKVRVSLLSDGHIDEVEITPQLESGAQACVVDLLLGTRFPAFIEPTMKFTWTFRP